MPLGAQFDLLHLHIWASKTAGDPLCIRARLQFTKVQAESRPMAARAEAWAIVVNRFGDRDKTGPSNVVEAVYDDEDGGKDNQNKPEGKVVYQRVV